MKKREISRCLRKSDKSSRIIIKPEWLNKLGEEIICVNFSEFIKIMNVRQWENINFLLEQKYKDDPKKRRALIRKYCALSRELEPDKNGRVNLKGMIDPNEEYILIEYRNSIEIYKKENIDK